MLDFIDIYAILDELTSGGHTEKLKMNQQQIEQRNQKVVDNGSGGGPENIGTDTPADTIVAGSNSNDLSLAGVAGSNSNG